MSRISEGLRSARQRVNPEGLVVGSVLSAAATGAMIPMEAGITYAINEVSRGVDFNLLKFAAIALLGIANMISVSIESRTLRIKQYSASPFGSALNILTGRPVLSSVGEHAVNYVKLSAFNPINAAAILNGNPQLLGESAVATSFAMTIWYSSANTLILRDKVDPVVNKLKSVRQSAWNKIKKREIDS